MSAKISFYAFKWHRVELVSVEQLNFLINLFELPVHSFNLVSHALNIGRDLLSCYSPVHVHQKVFACSPQTIIFLD